MAVHGTTLLSTGVDPALDLATAREHIAAGAFHPGAIGPVGLELEYHLIDRADPARRVSHAELVELFSTLGPLPYGSPVTLEPGGQVELSTPVQPDIEAAITALAADEDALTAAVRAAGFGLATAGTDPARPPRRVTSEARYAAMEAHFDAVGCGGPGREMMASTASLQVNLNAGPPARWAARLQHIHRLGPVFAAISACSPYLAGEASGWASMRQQTWSGIDPARSGPILDASSSAMSQADPSHAWADYALAAPVMLIRAVGDEPAQSITQRVSFADWITGAVKFYRRPCLADLDYHLSTLFPPVRPRGYLEIRYLDAVPRAWWPALATAVTTLVDDELAAAEVTEVLDAADLERVALGQGHIDVLEAGRLGLADPTLHRAAQRALEVAARYCPPTLRPAVESYADLIAQGRTPGDDLRDRALARGPLAALQEIADA